MNKVYQHQSDVKSKHFVYPEMFIQVLVKVDPGTVSNEKNKNKKINLLLVFTQERYYKKQTPV